MSRKRSREDASRHGPIPLPSGGAPVWGQFPARQFNLPRGWKMRPIWQTKASRQMVIFVIVAPLTMLALIALLVAVQALFQYFSH